MSPRAVPLVATIAVTLAVFSAVARADDAGQDLLRRGVELRRERRDAEALEAFRLALDRTNAPIARAEVALAEQALGRWEDAERDLVAARQTRDEWIEKNAGLLSGALDEIRQHLGWLMVVTEPAGATVTVDGRAIDAARSVRIEAGEHVIEARAPGYVLAVQRATIAGGGEGRVTLTLFAQEAMRGPPPRSDVAPTVAKWALASVGVAAIATGAYFGVRTIADKSARDAECSSGTCAPAAFGNDSDARSSAAISTASFGVALAALTGAAIWVLVDRPRSPRPPAVGIAF